MLAHLTVAAAKKSKPKQRTRFKTVDICAEINPEMRRLILDDTNDSNEEETSHSECILLAKGFHHSASKLKAFVPNRWPNLGAKKCCSKISSARHVCENRQKVAPSPNLSEPKAKSLGSGNGREAKIGKLPRTDAEP